MLHYEQVFGNIFERKERLKKGEQAIAVQMAKQLNTKNIKVVPGELFYRQCKAKFLLERDSLY